MVVLWFQLKHLVSLFRNLDHEATWAGFHPSLSISTTRFWCLTAPVLIDARAKRYSEKSCRLFPCRPKSEALVDTALYKARTQNPTSKAKASVCSSLHDKLWQSTQLGTFQEDIISFAIIFLCVRLWALIFMNDGRTHSMNYASFLTSCFVQGHGRVLRGQELA